MTDDILLPWEDTAARYQKKRGAIRKWSKSKSMGFPRPKRICGKLYFSLAELESWESRFADKFGSKAA